MPRQTATRPMPIHTQMEVALLATDAELFQEIGRWSYMYAGAVLPKQTSGGAARDEKGGREVFKHLLPHITRVVCDQWGACEKLSTFPDEATFGTAMAGALIADNVAPTPLPIAMIAVLTMRIGIKKLCKCG